MDAFREGLHSFEKFGPMGPIVAVIISTRLAAAAR